MTKATNGCFYSAFINRLILYVLQ